MCFSCTSERYSRDVFPPASTSAIDIIGRVALGEQRRRTPREIEPRQLDPILVDEPDLARSAPESPAPSTGATAGPAGSSSKYFRASSSASSVSIAPASASDALPGDSTCWKNALHVFERRGPDVLGRADRQPVVRMIRRIERRRDRHAGEAVGPVLVVLTPLVQHDVALVRELLRRERGQQIAHAIRFEPQRQLQRVGRHDLPVVRAIGVGRAVEQRARFLQRLEVAAIVVARSPRTSGARRGARSRSGRDARSSIRRDTRG